MVVAPINEATLQRDAALLQIAQIFRERVPLDLVFDVALLAAHPLLHPVVQRPHRHAFAHDFGRDALANLTLRTPILDERFGRPRKHVDEAGRDRHPFGVDHDRARFAAGKFPRPAMRSPRMATSVTRGFPPVPS